MTTNIVRQDLTSRELEILQLVVAGLENSEIAERLFLSHKTVGNRLITVFEKLMVPNRTMAALYAVSSGLCEMPTFDL